MSSDSKLAEIALPVAVDQTFTYLIPPELSSSAAIGSRVTVSFGRKYATGMIVGHPLSTTVPSLKPIHDVLDVNPVVSDELLRLTRWIAEYYFAPLGEVLKAALPQGMTASSKRIVRARLYPDAFEETLALLSTTAPRRAEILQLLKKEGEMTSLGIQKKLRIKSVHGILNEMERQGLIETDEVIPRPVTKPKMKEFVPLQRIDKERLSFEMLALPPRRKKAQHLLSALQELLESGKNEIGLNELLKTSGVSSATLKPLRENGLIPIVQRDVPRTTDYGIEEETRSITLNEVQQSILTTIIERIEQASSHTFLLHGVTGSGKTQVYIEAIRQCVQRGRRAIVLVPEISLTPQTVRRFKSHFGEKVAVVHSRMSLGERHDVWRQTLRGVIDIVIGPRSAIFSPLKNLGLIVVDEEHESSYKQYDSTPRYNARDVAIMRGNLNNAVVVLGSATPSAESFANATSGKFTLLEMPLRIDSAEMPAISIVDMTEERKKAYQRLKESLPEEQRGKLRDFQQPSLSEVLQQKIEDRLSRKEGIILLQNRRGFAPFVACPDCGYAESCDNCNVTLTYHLAKKHLRCHYCGHIRALHDVCPQCKGLNLKMHGAGTQKVEQDLAKYFPKAKILRMDLDTTSRKGAHDRMLTKFGAGDADILLGTQMVAKGLDFARVTLVGVISADTQMLLPDFRSSERTFQLLTQVSGRAGRSTLKGEVIIQTHQPNHYTLQHVVDHDFRTFYEHEMAERKELDYPPFSRLVLVEFKGPKEDHVCQQAESFARMLKAANGTFTILGPAPAVIGKINNQYRWHIILKTLKSTDPSGGNLRSVLRTIVHRFDDRKKNTVRLIIDVDPVGLM